MNKQLLTALLLSTLLIVVTTKGNHGIFYVPRHSLPQFIAVDQFMEYDYKHFNNLEVHFDDNLHFPRLEIRDDAGHIIKKYSLDNLRLKDLRELLSQFSILPKSRLLSPKEVSRLYEQVVSALTSTPRTTTRCTTPAT